MGLSARGRDSPICSTAILSFFQATKDSILGKDKNVVVSSFMMKVQLLGPYTHAPLSPPLYLRLCRPADLLVTLVAVVFTLIHGFWGSPSMVF